MTDPASIPLTIVDSFTDAPFTGNPAAVCVLAAPAPEQWMQALAAEVNLSETAFVVPRADGAHDLRWFTPTVEVDLCGHATLASAHVLGGETRFHTRSGVLTCSVQADRSIEMTFPADPLTATSTGGWAAALGLSDSAVVAAGRTPSGWDLIELTSEAAVRAVVMDREKVLALGGHVIAVADTTDSDEVHDSACRVFAPKAGIDEDPVTGSAHCVIGPWLAERTGRTCFAGRQVSARGGTVGMEVDGDRVRLRGRAVTLYEGRLTLAVPAT